MYHAILLFMLGFTGPVPLSEEIISVSDVAVGGAWIFLLDGRAQAVWKLDRQGNVHGSVSKRGQGPGEFHTAVSVTFFEDRLYICDMRRRMLMVYDTDLQFIVQHKLPGLCRDAVVTEDAVYIVMFDPQNLSMVQKYSRDMNHLASFGGSLQSALGAHSDWIGFESGELLLADGKLHLMHSFRPYLETFSLGGELLSSVKIAGFSGETIFDRRGNLSRAFKNMILFKGNTFVRLADYETGNVSTYACRRADGVAWRLADSPKLFPVEGRDFLHVQYDIDEEPIALHWFPSDALSGAVSAAGNGSGAD